MKNIKYKYQKYNKKFLFADAILTQYNDSLRSIKRKNFNETDIKVCRAFEPIAKNLLESFSDKTVLWSYILFNEFPHKRKSYIKKEIELSNINAPVSHASYYREVVLFTNLIAEYFNLSTEYVDSKKEIRNFNAPSQQEVISYIISFDTP